MTCESSKFRRELIQEILKDDIADLRARSEGELMPPSVSIVHMPSSTLQAWKNLYWQVKLLALVLIFTPATLMIWFTEISLLQNILASLLCLLSFGVGIVLGFIIDKGEKSLGFWKYERVGQKYFFPAFGWRYVA